MPTGADWGRPLAIGAGESWLAFEAPQHALVAPLSLRTVRDDGQPGYGIERFRIDDPIGGPQVLAVLNVRFEGEYDLAARRLSALQEGGRITLEPLPLVQGFVRFKAAPGVDLPEDLTRPQALVWDGPGGLKLSCGLNDAAARSLEQLLGVGVAPVVALAEVCAEGLAARADGEGRIDPVILIAALDAKSPWTRPDLIEALKANALEGVELRVQGATPDALEAALLNAADALADRLIGRFGALAPLDLPGVDVGWRFAFPEGSVSFKIRLDDVSLAPRGFVLSSEGAAPVVVRDRAAAPPPISLLPTGIHVINVDPNLPARHTAAAVAVQIEAPAKPPARPQKAKAHAVFDQGERSCGLSLRLGLREPLAFNYRTSITLVLPSGPRQLFGPSRPHVSPILTVPPDAFPVRFVRIEAMASLLQLGDLDIAVEGEGGGEPFTATAMLDVEHPVIAVACLPDTTGTFVATLKGRNGETPVVLEPRTFADDWLDVAHVPGQGPKAMQVMAEFDSAAKTVEVEVAAECAPDRVVLLRVTPTAPNAEFTWFADDPFRPGVKLRWNRPGALWSPAAPPAACLIVKSSAAAATDWPGAAVLEPTS